ncbi:phage major capsid protein [Methylocaldum sp. GT1TLB]|uniref:phage major capsid protein n=1 Tax=Methylocaldum sp. GT1TLB TaxID=3438965 RepID=UPI003D9FDD58
MNLSHIQARMREICPVAGVFGMADYSGWNNRALEDRLLDLSNEASAIRATAERQNRDLTESEAQEIDRVLAAFEEVEAELGSRGSKGRKTAPGAPAGGGLVQRTSIEDMIRPNAAQTIAAMFPRDTHGFRNLAEFMAALASERGDSRLRVGTPIHAAGMTEGTGSSGGFLVPPQFLAEILGPAFVESGILSRVSVVPMTSSAVMIAGFNNTDSHAGGAIGGLTMEWAGEGQQLSSQTGKVRAVTMQAKKGAVMVEVTNELLFDSPAASIQLREIMSAAARFGLEAAILTGNGVGRPLGLLNDNAKIVIGKETSQAADTINYQNIIKMVARIHPSLLPGAVWVANPTTLTQLLNIQRPISDAAGTDYVGGDILPVFQTGVGGTFSLLGLPLVFSEALPVLGDAGDLVLASFSEYLLGLRLDARLDVSTEFRFDHDKSVFRLILRADGLSRWDQALQPMNGNTLSWATTLEERAAG